jgi:hypothetical protein
MKRTLLLGAIGLVALTSGLEGQTRESGSSGRPGAQATLFVGGHAYGGSSEFFDMVQRELTLEIGDFRSLVVGAEVHWPRNDRLGLLIGGDFARRAVASEAVRAVGGTQEQETTLRAAAAYAGVEIRLRSEPLDQGRAGWDPHVVLSAGVIHHDLAQDGRFVDRLDPSDQFGYRFGSAGWGGMGEAGLGVRRALSERSSLTTSIRYRLAEATMRDEFAGFDPLSLSGLRWVVGGSIQIGSSERR